jgi:hypothetical protein
VATGPERHVLEELVARLAQRLGEDAHD